MTGNVVFARFWSDPADRAHGRKMLIRLLAERIVAEYLAEQEMLGRAQPGDKSIEPDQASDAPGLAPIDVPIVKPR